MLDTSSLAPVPSPSRPESLSAVLSPATANSRKRMRRFPSVKRATSVRSLRGSDGYSQAEGAEVEEIDRREGVYDTSKKQRVPSWVSGA